MWIVWWFLGVTVICIVFNLVLSYFMAKWNRIAREKEIRWETQIRLEEEEKFRQKQMSPTSPKSSDDDSRYKPRM